MTSFTLALADHAPLTGTLELPGGIPLPAGEFARVLHDDEAMDDKGQRIRAPEVWPLYEVSYTPLTEAWQWFWFRQLIHSYTGFRHWDETLLTQAELDTLKGKWRSLTKGTEAFTNNHGTETYRDYISNRNLGAGLPSQGAITCCGNVVKIVGGATAKGTPIWTLDGTKPPPPIERVNRLTTPWLIFCAVNIPGYVENRVEYPLYVTVNGVRRVKADPFPQLETFGRDTLVQLRSNGNKTGITYQRDGINYAVNFIKSSRLV